MGPKSAPGVIWRSPQPSKNESKTHPKITPTCPFALPEHENCRFHRMQKSYINQTIINRISFASRSANGAPKDNLEAAKWAENSTKTHRADSAPNPKLRKNTPGARSRHSERVRKWKNTFLKAEIELYNIRNFFGRARILTNVDFKFFLPRGDDMAAHTPQHQDSASTLEKILSKPAWEFPRHMGMDEIL